MPVAALPGVESFAADAGGTARRAPSTIVGAPPALAAEMAARLKTPIAPAPTRVAVLDDAALTYVAFAAGSPTLFALTSPFMQDICLSTLMSLNRGRYLSLHGEAVAPDPDMNSDFRIDPGRFGVMLADIV